MAEKNNEVKELREKNEILQKTVNERFSVRSGGGWYGAPVEGQAGRASFEPVLNPAAQETKAGGLQQDHHQLFQGTGESGGNPPGARGPYSVPGGNLGGLPDRRVRDDGRPGLGGNPSVESSGPMHANPSSNSAATSGCSKPI